MKRFNKLLLITITLFITTTVAAFDEKPVDITPDQLKQIVDAAPPLPAQLIENLGLTDKLTLVDFIDCTDPDDPHPFLDQGTSSIVDSTLGRYRITAEHRHAFFTYRWHARQKSKPHLLIIEYPDDAQREICFLTHESQLTGARNADWSLETGVYTGNPLPSSNKMQYHTMFFWPEDNWPAVIVANFNRSGPPAAASRIWVCAIEGDLPPVPDPAPDVNDSRMIGSLYDWSLVPVQGVFGLANRQSAFENIAQYYAYTGQNMVGWPVVSNNNWGFKCIIPAWGQGDRFDELEGILAACDKHNIKFVATFELGRRFLVGGLAYTPENKTAYKQKLLEGFKQFFDRYGHHQSLYAIAFGMPDFGPPYGNATLDIVRELFDGDIGQFTQTVNSYHPSIKIYTFIGAEDLHRQYFSDAWDVLHRWEQNPSPWNNFLASEVNNLWIKWQRDPAEFLNIPNLTVAHQYQPDDHAIYDEYSQQPRSMFYYDIDTSTPKSDIMNTPAAMIWNSFFEAWFGLHPGNFWYRKLWVAPDFNASPPHAMAPYARVLAHRDRNFIIAGAWNNKPGGQEASIRQFATAFRSLPPADLSDVTPAGTTPVNIRAGIYQSKGYVSLVNNTPFDQTLILIVNEVNHSATLQPHELKVLTFENVTSDWPVAAFGEASSAYIDWLESRLKQYDTLLAEVTSLNPDAAPAAYSTHSQRAHTLLAEKQFSQLDEQLGFGLTGELQLRKQILTPPQISVPRVTGPIQSDNLDDWPDNAADITIDKAENLAAHLYFPNSWTGPADLSARLRLAHDGENLYIGVQVRDSVNTEKDLLELFFSPENYLKWQQQNLDYEIHHEKSLNLSNPPSGNNPTLSACTFTIPLKEIDPQDSGRTGFFMLISDEDNEGNTYTSRWARKQALAYPNRALFAYYSDARSCAQLLFQ